MAEFFSLLLEPNIIYFLLVLGLWLGATAVFIPGIGIPEVGSIVLITLSLIIMGLMPTNWMAVLLIVIGVASFLLLPLRGEKYARFSEVGLVFQAIGGYFLFTEQSVSLVLIAITVFLGFLYNRYLLRPIMKSQREQSAYDVTNKILGAHGRVVQDIDRIGTVYVNKELWRARSDEALVKDTQIVVTAVDGLELIVEKSKRD